MAAGMAQIEKALDFPATIMLRGWNPPGVETHSMGTGHQPGRFRQQVQGGLRR